MPNTHFPAYLLLPFVAAGLYALASLYIKKSLLAGASLRQVFHASNLIFAAAYIPLLFVGSETVNWASVHLPVLVGATIYIGAYLNLAAIRAGDVSLVNPLLGTKAVFVAFLAVFFGSQGGVPFLLWCGAILSASGIFLLGGRSFLGHTSDPSIGRAVTLALTSAAVFAITDSLLSRWASSFGLLRFVAIMSLTLAALSVTLNPLLLRGGHPRRRKLAHIPKQAWPSLLAGSLLMGAQAIIMGLTIGFFRDPTGINIVYSSRGLWSLALVAVFAATFATTDAIRSDSGEGRKSFWWRLSGTVVLTAGIIVAVLARAHADGAP